MGSLKKSIKRITNQITGAAKTALGDITGANKAEDKAKKAVAQAEVVAAAQADSIAQATAAKNATGTADGEDATTSIGNEENSNSAKKKKVSTGKRSLSISRSSGTGINI